MVGHLIQYTPEQLGLPFTTWSVKTLHAFITDLVGLSISESTVYRDLCLMNIHYSQTKDGFLWKPINYEIKKAWLTILQRYTAPRTRVIFVDEKGPVHALRYKGHQWSVIPPIRDVRQKSRGKVSFLGGYDPKTKELEMFPLENHRSTSFCQTMELIRMTFLTADYNRLIVVLDNASWHRSKYTQEYFAGDQQIELFFLPAYSPELTPIERCFGSYTRECLNNGSFTTKSDVVDRTFAYCHYFNTLRREIYA